jgi:hypothetical protein
MPVQLYVRLRRIPLMFCILLTPILSAAGAGAQSKPASSAGNAAAADGSGSAAANVGPSPSPNPIGIHVERLPAAAGVAGFDRDPRAVAMDAALDALGPAVVHSSDPEALRLAFRAYFNYRHANPHLVRRPYLYFVDLGLHNAMPRGYVFDMDRLTVVEGPFPVAHGRGSSPERNGVPTRFSNTPNSFMSSLGLYLAEETYTFRGRAAGGAYSSIGLRLRGESGAFNSAARRRGIVAHGAPYVTAREAGRSEGCPAMEQERAHRLLPLLAEGGVVFIFSPRDPAWRSLDPWLSDDWTGQS